MSMMRLLSAGRSLVGLEDNGKQYRMSHPGALPKFGSGKNPFLEIKAMTPAKAKYAAAEPRDWVGKFGGLLRKREKRQIMPRFAPSAIQGELSLEKVKVV